MPTQRVRHFQRLRDCDIEAAVASRTLRTLIPVLEALRDEMRARHARSSDTFDLVHTSHRRSAENLLDYLTLRSHDIRQIQAALAELGVSSLGRAEEHVIRSIEQVISVLRTLAGECAGRRTEAAVALAETVQ
jgi:pyruvate kinase